MRHIGVSDPMRISAAANQFFADFFSFRDRG